MKLLRLYTLGYTDWTPEALAGTVRIGKRKAFFRSCPPPAAITAPPASCCCLRQRFAARRSGAIRDLDMLLRMR